ncbi:MAG: hypothetical protein WB439_13890 [Acidobacteriaceae bacterium]
MIDIQPPEHTPHTWREFFIHIATIVLGLVIAIGLEQSVELFHHHRQVVETREALRIERDHNRQAFAEGMQEFYRQTAALDNNLLVLNYLRTHPHPSPQDLPGVLVWHATRTTVSDSAWRTAQQSNVTALMPQSEVRRDAILYEHIDTVEQGVEHIWPTIVQARIFFMAHPDLTTLTPAEIDQAIQLTQAVQAAHFTQASALVQLSRLDAGFTPILTVPQLSRIMHVDVLASDPAYAAAAARTNARVPSFFSSAVAH